MLPVERQHCPQVALFGVQDFDGDFVHPGTAPALDWLVVSHHPEKLESTKIILPFVGMANVFPLKLPSQCCVAPSDLPTYRLQFRTLAFTPELPPSGCFSAATSRACPVSSLHLHLAFHRFDRGNLQETRLSPRRASTHRFHRWDPQPRTTNVSRQIWELWPFIISMDWFKGKFTGKPHISWGNPWFPVNFPSKQSIDNQIFALAAVTYVKTNHYTFFSSWFVYSRVYHRDGGHIRP